MSIKLTGKSFIAILFMVLLFVPAGFCYAAVPVLNQEELVLGSLQLRTSLDLDQAEQTLGKLLKTDSYFTGNIQCDEFYFKSGEIRTYKNSSDENIIFGIWIHNDNVATTRAVRVGSTLTDVIKAYGLRSPSVFNYGNHYNYWAADHSASLTFAIDECGTVVEIVSGFSLAQ